MKETMILGASGVVSLLLLLLSIRYYRKTKKQLIAVNAMLNRALTGRFQERLYDESYLSALETKMYQYLTACQKEEAMLQEERDAIKTLISDISHQTKTPIANLRLYGQLLQEQCGVSQETDPLMKELVSQTEKLDFLIQSLIKLSRLESGIITLAPEKNSVKDLLTDIIDTVAIKAVKKNITITRDLSDLSAVFDWKWTAEAIGNILDNSIKYTPEGGHIAVTMTEYPSFCRIDIVDNGMGIGEEEIPKIFGRFYRSPAVKNEEGCGIGLYLARTIIHRQYGYIKVTSQLGKGSTFSVLLCCRFFSDDKKNTADDRAVFTAMERYKGNEVIKGNLS